MISFKQFLRSFKKKYVCLKFTDETNNNLRKFALDKGFDLSVKYNEGTQRPEDFDFHLTVFYTISTHNIANSIVDIEPFKINIKKLALLGKDKDVPVLILNKNQKLNNIRKMFEQQGFRDNWPNYKAHISLSYDKKQYDLSSIPIPNFDIVVNRLEVSDQEE